MHKIKPNLWFDKQAKEAAEFYVSLLSSVNTQAHSKINYVKTLRNTPSGDTDIVDFELAGHPFMAISAGPLFKFNPSISFILNFDPSRDKDAKTKIDKLWEKLSKAGEILIPIQKYQFSEHYGWLKDKFGVSWQIVPSIMNEMIKNGSQQQIDRVTQAFLPMKKIIITDLEKAYKGGD
ncbi:MAG: 3-demethylubiquinone-9 3-methyltransferase [Parcubacteria group bacterium GW2011_GWA2_31_28]|nr:MAG: 3-demethylubiquinone-9 3-methyltransferase [Parcubacteria group bacterium GW2011_GWA2_31_28]